MPSSDGEKTAIFVPGATHWPDISDGQLNRKARAARAGLTMFMPMPPKSCLTSTIAKQSAIRIVQ